VADAWRKGGADALIAREGFKHVKSSLKTYERQILNGTGADAAGFVGMADVLDDPDMDMVVNADGSVTGGDLTSVYAIRLGDDDVKGVYKGDGPIIEMGETTVQMLPGTNSKLRPCYVTPATAWLGLQVGSPFSFGRICNIGIGNNETLTDDLVYELLERFPDDRQPNLLVMSRRSLFQLRASRTATSATGAPAPIPTEVEGIPIVTTTSISNDEDPVT
jgi:hypothetical protein